MSSLSRTFIISSESRNLVLGYQSASAQYLEVSWCLTSIFFSEQRNKHPESFPEELAEDWSGSEHQGPDLT